VLVGRPAESETPRAAARHGGTAVLTRTPRPPTQVDVRTGVATRAAPRAATPRWTPAAGTDAFTAPLLTGPRTVARRARFGLVNLCTCASVLLGMTAVFLAFAGDIRLAAAILLGCVMFDGLDGQLARRLGVSTPFGAQMDSLADMCSFGIATPVVAYVWLAGDGGASPWLIGPACALVAVCAALRLARFNVSPKDGPYFCGVPTTIAAGIIATCPLFVGVDGPVLFVVLVASLALLMVSTFPYVKVGKVLRMPLWVWLVVVAAGFVLQPAVAFTSAVVVYLASGPVLWIRERRAAPG